MLWQPVRHDVAFSETCIVSGQFMLTEIRCKFFLPCKLFHNFVKSFQLIVPSGRQLQVFFEAVALGYVPEGFYEVIKAEHQIWLMNTMISQMLL